MYQRQIVMLGASLEQNGGIATVEKLLLKYIPPEIQIHHITSHDEGTVRHRVVVFGRAWLALLWYLISQKIDLVYIHLSDGGSLLRKAILSLTAFLFRKPVLMHAHGAEFHVTYAKLPSVAQQVISNIFRRCDRFIVLSETWKTYYMSELKLKADRVLVLPNPVELPVQVPHRVNRDTLRLAFCGRVGQRKGVFDLIRAIANLLVEQQQQVQFLLAGDGEIEAAHQLAKELQVDKLVTFLGWVTAEQRDRLLAEADVFILPSYNEGLPMALLEAMGWGLPAIVTPVGGIPELIRSGENGLLVSPGNLAQLSEAIQRVISDEQLRTNLGNAARRSVMPYDIKGYCSTLMNIYDMILQPIKIRGIP